MESLKKLQALILKVIIFLIWLDLAYFAVLAAGTLLKWAFLGSNFHMLFAMSFGILAVLSVFHIVLTLNIMSRSIETIAKEKSISETEEVAKTGKRYKKWMALAIGGILIVVAGTGVAEYYGIKQKNVKTQEKVGEAARSSLTARIVDLIEQDVAISRLYSARDELLLSMGGQNGVTMLIPKQGAEGQVFYQITPWDSQFSWHPAMETKDESKKDLPVSKSLKVAFYPRQGEEKKFKQLLQDQKPFSVTGEYQCRAFWPVVRNGQIKLILLSDAEINISGDMLYSRSSRSQKTV